MSGEIALGVGVHCCDDFFSSSVSIRKTKHQCRRFQAPFVLTFLKIDFL